jgi:hypothetical protein
MPTGPILVLVALLGGGYFVGEAVVSGIKTVDKKIVQVAKATGKKTIHILTLGKK